MDLDLDFFLEVLKVFDPPVVPDEESFFGPPNRVAENPRVGKSVDSVDVNAAELASLAALSLIINFLRSDEGGAIGFGSVVEEDV